MIINHKETTDTDIEELKRFLVITERSISTQLHIALCIIRELLEQSKDITIEENKSNNRFIADL
jgi:hypothetical protein